MSQAKTKATQNVQARAACALIVSWLLLPLAEAGEIQSLAWASGDVPTLEVHVAGDASYELQTLEGGQRARLVFSGSTLGTAVSELPGVKHVKGVYPYVGAAGAGVNVDLVLSEPAQINLEKTAYGYAVVVAAENAAPSPAPSATTDSATGAQNAIKEMVYAKLPGNRIQLTLRMTRKPVEPNAFATTNPARVALDFADTKIALATKTLPVKDGAVVSATAVEAEGRSRVVFSLVKPVSYTTSIEGNNYILTFNAPASDLASADQTKTTHFASSRKTGKYSLKAVDFRRGPQGDGKIIINLSDPTVGVDIREQAGEIVVDFQNTSVLPEMQRRLDVVDFATPVQTIDTFAQGANTRMVISPKGRYEHIAYQTGDVFTISIKPVIEKPDEKKVDEFGYSGEKLSLNFQNIDVRAALQVLADFTGLNFVVSDSVKGSLTLRLKDVPWDQALDLVVDSKNLAVRRKGNVITVAPAAEVAAKEKAAFEASKSLIELEPLVSELIQISYAKAEEVAALLKSIQQVAAPTAIAGAPILSLGPTTGLPGASNTGSNTLLSPRGQVTVDARTNSLLIQDIPGKIREVRKLIAQLDQPVRQVLIETRLVEATDNFARSLGVRFGVKKADVGNAAGSRDVAVSGNIQDSSSIVSAGTLGAGSNGLNVNLGSFGVGGRVAASVGLTVAKLGGNGDLLNLEISALEQEGNGKIISSPRVITANQKKAKIEQGQERVVTVPGAGAGTGAVSLKRATLKLEVVPRITPDDRINLEVDITKDNFVSGDLLNVKNVNTQVLLDNGETVVIGGIYEQDKNDTITKVPVFGDIPLLGWLFKTKDVRDNKTELLIFLTPRIVAENLTLR